MIRSRYLFGPLTPRNLEAEFDPAVAHRLLIACNSGAVPFRCLDHVTVQHKVRCLLRTVFRKCPCTCTPQIRIWTPDSVIHVGPEGVTTTEPRG